MDIEKWQKRVQNKCKIKSPIMLFTGFANSFSISVSGHDQQIRYNRQLVTQAIELNEACAVFFLIVKYFRSDDTVHCV